jgi:hypothetical protein
MPYQSLAKALPSPIAMGLGRALARLWQGYDRLNGMLTINLLSSCIVKLYFFIIKKNGLGSHFFPPNRKKFVLLQFENR